MSSVFVNAQTLSKTLKQSSVLLLDCSWFLPMEGRNPREEWYQKRIPGSHYFAIDKVCDPRSRLPNMLPSVGDFHKHLSGLEKFEEVVLYDSSNFYIASSRVLWMFQVFGYDNVHVLEGGLRAWEKAGLELSSGENTTPKNNPPESKEIFRDHLVCTFEQMKQLSVRNDTKNPLVIDARSPERFSGIVEEPRANLRSGSIPGSVNVFYRDLFPSEGGSFLDQQTVKKKFESAGVDFSLCDQPTPSVITTCGSGVTACILSLALKWLGMSNVGVYDGSWTEWGQEGNGVDIRTEG
eukprot:CAMPEP_0201491160 /NCGR_PEP_ID=MMETSP0151_2-20130828/28804_1 /ASSEMBLY_ACC=CAM_ASM_000257 /TAXON_ID=200890 /ORGANISM="Paramoeba atlantica, Strain 621/1 / CCAP 1560/9" /LENGTH=293 /DNA_ID=CAMNT_0047877387 /DNA_START=10 /DNA_END=891 /DNA_ORIENTATION=+